VDTIVITVPVSDIFYKSYCYFYELHGCTIECTDERVHNMRIYRFTFPGGTKRQELGNGCYLLKLPKGTDIEVTPTPEGHCYLSVYAVSRVNDVFRNAGKEARQ